MTDAESKALAAEIAKATPATLERAEVYVRSAAAAGFEALDIREAVTLCRGSVPLAEAFLLDVARAEKELIEGDGSAPAGWPLGILSGSQPAGKLLGLPVYTSPDVPPATAIVGTYPKPAARVKRMRSIPFGLGDRRG